MNDSILNILMFLAVFALVCSSGCVNADETGVPAEILEIGNTIPPVGWVFGMIFTQNDISSEYQSVPPYQMEQPVEEGTVVRDLKDPSMSTNVVIYEGYETDLYNNYITFVGGPSHDLKLTDVVPTVYITTVYYVDEVTSKKGYTSEYGSKEWVEEWITQPNPNAAFEITVYNSNGEAIATEGYGGRKYDLTSSDTIKLLRGGDYTVSMEGQAIGVDVRIYYK